jgi:predicted lipid-binding transport protein (Tim44 family)
MVVLGVILIIIGLLFTLTIIGWFIGVPLMIIGAICCVAGNRRNTVIHNTVTYSNTAPAPPQGQPSGVPQQPSPQSYAMPNSVAAQPQTSTLENAGKACPSCGAQNGAAGRFCNHCGSSLAPQVT